MITEVEHYEDLKNFLHCQHYMFRTTRERLRTKAIYLLGTTTLAGAIYGSGEGMHRSTKNLYERNASLSEIPASLALKTIQGGVRGTCLGFASGLSLLSLPVLVPVSIINEVYSASNSNLPKKLN